MECGACTERRRGRQAPFAPAAEYPQGRSNAPHQSHQGIAGRTGGAPRGQAGLSGTAGGGPGRYTLELAKRGYEIILLDLIPDMLDIAKKEINKSGFQDRIKG